MVMCWVWNLKGGWLTEMDFFDLGGSMIIFGPASIAGLIGAVTVGPRYFKSVSKADRKRLSEGNAME